MPERHPPPELLLDYASGGACEATRLIVSGHLTLCPACRGEVAALERIGGALLDGVPPEPLSEGRLEEALRRLADEETDQAADEAADEPDEGGAPENLPRLPRPLEDRVRRALACGGWKRLGPGVAKLDLPVNLEQGKFRLIRVAGGRVIPSHTHHGPETTLVLSGGFEDENGHVAFGDVVVQDSETTHRIVVDQGEDCLMLTLNAGPLSFRGPWAPLLNLFGRD